MKNKNLLQRIEKFALLQASTPLFTKGFRQRLSGILRSVETLSLEDCKEADKVATIYVHKIAKNWKENRVSNYTLFGLRKIRKGIKKRITLLKTFSPVKLNTGELFEKITQLSTQGQNVRFPNSAKTLLSLAEQSRFCSRQVLSAGWVPSSVPVLFVLNPLFFNSNYTYMNVVSGHCLVGMEPNEEYLSSIVASLNYGLLAYDSFIYNHVRNIFDLIEESGVKVDLKIFLDVRYYEDKLVARSKGALSKREARRLLSKIVTRQSVSIKAIVPEGEIYNVSGQLDSYLDVNWSKKLVLFLQKLFPLYSADRIKSIALVAATYLHLPLQNIPILVVESALNVQVPVSIVLPFLEKYGLVKNFCFVGLLPLSDLKVSYGSMYFGGAESGKLFVDLPQRLAKKRMNNISTNTIKPYDCFYVRYFLAKNNHIPSEYCHSQLCQAHIKELIDDFTDFAAKLEKRKT